MDYAFLLPRIEITPEVNATLYDAATSAASKVKGIITYHSDPPVVLAHASEPLTDEERAVLDEKMRQAIAAITPAA